MFYNGDGTYMGGERYLPSANLNTAEKNVDTIMQWIMDERLRELAAEGHRWFDLWQLARTTHGIFRGFIEGKKTWHILIVNCTHCL